MNLRRIRYVDEVLSKRVVATLVELTDELKRDIQKDPKKLPQQRHSSLAGNLEMLALYGYALGDSVDVVLGLLQEAVDAKLRVFESRGGEVPFPSDLVMIDGETVVDSQPRYADGERDFSLTNSKSGMHGVYLALIAGQDLKAHRLAQLIGDPADAEYLGEDSSVCTPDDQRLAYAVRMLLTGNEDGARKYLESIRRSDGEIPPQRDLLRAIVDRDGASFLRALDRLLSWHADQAGKKRNQKDPGFFLAIPALALSSLALRRKIVAPADLPDIECFPRNLVERA